MIAISDAAGDDFVTNLGLDASRIDVTPLGVSALATALRRGRAQPGYGVALASTADRSSSALPKSARTRISARSTRCQSAR